MAGSGPGFYSILSVSDDVSWPPLYMKKKLGMIR